MEEHLPKRQEEIDELLHVRCLLSVLNLKSDPSLALPDSLAKGPRTIRLTCLSCGFFIYSMRLIRILPKMAMVADRAVGCTH